MSTRGILIGAVMILFVLANVVVISCVLANDIWNDKHCDDAETRCDSCLFPCTKHEERR